MLTLPGTQAALTCFTDNKYPKLFSASGVDEGIYSMLNKEDESAVFAGGHAGYLGSTRAFVMRVNTDTATTKWRRFFHDSAGSAMNTVTAIALVPGGSGTSIACHGSVLGANWSHHSWVWTIRSSDGGFETDMIQITHGDAGIGEHIAFDG